MVSSRCLILMVLVAAICCCLVFFCNLLVPYGTAQYCWHCLVLLVVFFCHRVQSGVAVAEPKCKREPPSLDATGAGKKGK